MLSCLHDNTREEDGEESCVVHNIFGINTLSLVICSSCKETSEPTPNLHFVEYTYADDLRAQHKKFPNYSFEKLIHITNQEYKGCPKDDKHNPCPNVQNQVEKHLLNIPGVIAFGLVWPTATPEVRDIMETLEIIQPEISLEELFLLSSKEQADASYRFRGMICYYGKHYNAYFYNESAKQWIVFDDATVKQVGANWSDVLTRCQRGHFHPSVLFYEKNESKDSQKPPREFVVEKQDSPTKNESSTLPTYITGISTQETSTEEKKFEFRQALQAERGVRGGIPTGYRLVPYPTYRRNHHIKPPFGYTFL